jgi:hypothetical protein
VRTLSRPPFAEPRETANTPYTPIVVEARRLSMFVGLVKLVAGHIAPIFDATFIEALARGGMAASSISPVPVQPLTPPYQPFMSENQLWPMEWPCNVRSVL